MFKSRKNRYDHQREREDIVAMRANSLEWVQKYRERGYCIFYQEELGFSIMSQGKVWQEDGGEIMYKVPCGSGDCAIALIWALRKPVSWMVACLYAMVPCRIIITITRR
jgi:hypothetical protein